MEWPPALVGVMAEFHEYCIMKEVSVSRLQLEHPTDERFALSIHLIYPFLGLDWGTPNRFSIISSPQFCKLIKLLSGQHWSYFHTDSLPYVKVSLNFYWETPFYNGNQSLKDQIIGSIRLLKGQCMDDNELPGSPAKKVRFQIQGELDGEQVKAIQTQHEEPLQLAHLFQYSRDFLDLAKDLFDQGFLEEAKGAYCAASAVVSQTVIRDLNDEQWQERYLTDLERHIQTSHILSKLKHKDEAVREAYIAYKLWRYPNNQLPAIPHCPMSSKQFGDRLAKALTDDGLLGSLGTLCKSVEKSWTDERQDDSIRMDMLLLHELVHALWPAEIDSEVSQV